MRVGINGTCLNDRPSGARQRFIGLYEQVFRLLPTTEFVVYEPRDCALRAWFEPAANVQFRQTPMFSEARLKRGVVGAAYWATAARLDRLDLLECSHLPLVAVPGVPTVLTVHDIRGIHGPADSLKVHFYSAVLRHGLSRASRVVTVSETMRQEILRFRPGTDVRVIYNGVDPRMMRPVTAEALAKTREKLHVEPGFILSVGHLEPRKNYPTLVAAVAKLRDRGVDAKLVIVGNDSGSRREVLDRVQHLRLEDRVRIMQGVSDDDLRALYRLAAVLAFPSTYEGFGIPVLEAMAADLPMVLSDTPVFRELAGDGALYFPTHDQPKLADVLAAVLTSGDQRATLVRAGKGRLDAFAYVGLAEAVAQVYEGLAG